MYRIDFLNADSQTAHELAAIWVDVLGQTTAPNKTAAEISEKFLTLTNNTKVPLTLVAYNENNQIVGGCSLREEDGIHPELTPWLGPLIVKRTEQGNGLGRLLIKSIEDLANKFGFKDIFLFTFDETLPAYYQRLGWQEISRESHQDKPITVMKKRVT